jgi:hypothetical protein
MAEVAADIIKGHHDEELDAIYRALKQRHKALQQAAGLILEHAFNVGDRVELKDVKPKYMNGHKGEIVAGPNGGLFDVRLDKPHGKFREVIRCRPQTLRKL